MKVSDGFFYPSLVIPILYTHAAKLGLHILAANELGRHNLILDSVGHQQ